MTRDDFSEVFRGFGERWDRFRETARDDHALALALHEQVTAAVRAG
ncbi:hypothetical protein [Frankia gtarii]|nr:hypothetical protein [Frankia gtarii]